MQMIKLLKTPFGHYLYDAHANKVAKISQALYDAMSDDKSTALADTPEVLNMREDGFFNEDDFEMCVVEDAVLETMYQRALRSIILQVTQSCNFRCTYCPYTENTGDERTHSGKRMSWDTAKKSIDFLHDHSVDSDVIVIGFYGGEPLLEFSLVKKVMEYAKQRFEGKEVMFTITTNATLLSDEIMSYLNENNVFFMISLDGPKAVNDSHRVFATGRESTFDAVILNLKTIAEKYPHLRNNTTINMVVDPGLDYDQYMQMFDDDSITSKFAIRSQLVDNTGLEKPFIASDEFIKRLRYFDFINALCENNKVDAPNYRGLITDDNKWSAQDKYKPLDAGPITEAASPAGPCIPGFMKLFVNVDGQFYPCERTSEVHSVLNIGDLDSGFDIQKCKNLVQMPKITEVECKSCFAFRFCDSCHAFVSSHEGLDRNKRLNMCPFIKRRVTQMLERYTIERRHSIREYI